MASSPVSFLVVSNTRRCCLPSLYAVPFTRQSISSTNNQRKHQKHHQRQFKTIKRYFTFTSALSHSVSYNTNNSSTDSNKGSEKLRVAIVGGGCAGLSAALHLAELVERGLIAGPIDLYEGQSPRKREIGVGIWSTALQPFRECQRQSHALVYNEMTKTYGTYIGDVGYRIPNGKWLMKSHLPNSEEELLHSNGMPALFFIREMDMIQSLQKAIHWEEHLGNIKVYRNYKNQQGGQVYRLEENSIQPYSSRLVLNDTGTLLSDRDYHLIVAADGTYSVLRQRYAGHDYVSRVLTGTSALPTPNMNFDMIDQRKQQQQPSSSSSVTSAVSDQQQSQSWEHTQQQHAVGLQDRKYTVFRGNARMTSEEMRKYDPTTLSSFQTWGEGNSMRFATVPMKLRDMDERQVWFITIDDDGITSEPDPIKRRDMLLEQFHNWHDPICRIVSATPPDEILMERAIAHKHNMGPVLNFNQVIQQITGNRPPNAGDGPFIVYHGDAYMTVDPILAQGFTWAMEGSYDLRQAIERALLVNNNNNSTPIPSSYMNSTVSNLSFDPYQLQYQLRLRHDRRMDRLICLLRATELVQALGQLTGGKLGGFFHTFILRPVTRTIPNFIKRPIFDAVLKYSLGLGLFPIKPVIDNKK